VANLPLVSRTPATNFATSNAGVVENGGKVATGVNDTGSKFAAGVNDTGGAPANISAKFQKNLKRRLWCTQEHGRNRFRKKNLKSKIS
jgi:hypothetical protein